MGNTTFSTETMIAGLKQFDVKAVVSAENLKLNFDTQLSEISESFSATSENIISIFDETAIAIVSRGRFS